MELCFIFLSLVDLPLVNRNAEKNEWRTEDKSNDVSGGGAWVVNWDAVRIT